LDPGVVALCSGSIVSHLYGSILSYIWLADRPAKFVWRPDDFKYILEHGKWLLVSAVLTFLMNTVDKVYLASRLDAVELGIYSIATNLGLLAYELATKIGNSVVFPAFSERLRDDRSRLMIDYYKVRRPFEYLALAGGFFLLAFGGDVIHLFYDSRYHAAGDILKALGLFTLMIAYAPSTDAYLAMGEARYNSFVYFVRLSSLIIGLILLVPHFGALGGAFALAVSGFNGALAILICNHRLGLFSWKQESRLLAIFVLGCAAVASLEYVRRAA
jgi:O-antigen/teichoic acid export membrane protein